MAARVGDRDLGAAGLRVDAHGGARAVAQRALDLEVDPRLLAGDDAQLDGDAQRAQLGGDAPGEGLVLGGAEQHHRTVAGRRRHGYRGGRRRDQAAYEYGQ